MHSVQNSLINDIQVGFPPIPISLAGSVRDFGDADCQIHKSSTSNYLYSCLLFSSQTAFSMNYISHEEYCLEFTHKLEEELMDLAVLKQKAIQQDLYPAASKFRDIESVTLKFLQTLKNIEEKWAESYESGWRI
jgi:hypothetical protein